MAQIRNKIDLEYMTQEEKTVTEKSLPRFFNENDGLGVVSGISFSVITHGILILLMFIFNFIANIIMPYLPKPELPSRDIEFKLVQNESKPPINKKTKIRSDRDSQAGGKHDPNRPVSEPSPAPKKAVQKQSKPAEAPKQATQPKKQPIQNPLQKLVSKQPVQRPQTPTVQKPTPVKPSAPAAPKAPVASPIAKPTGIAKPQAPKVATAPKSPFSIPTKPNTSAGTGYKPAGSPAGGSVSGSKGGTGSGIPSPTFSATKGSGSSGSRTSGSGGSKYASRGTGGYGSGGNPSPGNPNGKPGIDAIKQVDMGPYMRDLEQRIKRNWHPPTGGESKRVVILFKISRDGRLLSHKITKSSGVPLADQAALHAIEATAPFRPLPPEYKDDYANIDFTFDYNVLRAH